MQALINLGRSVFDTLDRSGEWVALLLIRLLMAWEFGRAGLMKLNGTNWFGRVQDNFPFPFNVVPVEISWFLATWFEILGAIGLVLGLFTRFWAFSLIILTVVAISGVHWPESYGSFAELWESYSVSKESDMHGNFRIPLLFIAMLLPLMFRGAGKLSLDNIVAKKLG
ncbi:MAG: DoxX family protein [Gammaproteobacteria bacterium]|nr:DoxX family protein [Gammaproteobacteria bacterium]MBT8104232.1 DoxX family protein [Gammaproteobacteria bacterium]NNF49071.1 DoxX family protein [Woeseiaceae bacterium]NNK24247.1 DoxX family protein [Woeseiaceae bacterium]NNL63866.1 DoxX family protein [Woeseiaceae bacterium]